MSNELIPTHRNHDRVQEQIDRNQRNGDSDSLFETTEEDDAKNGNQCQGHAHLMFQQWRSKRVLDDVGRSVGSRESDGDDEVGSDEAEQNEYEEFAFPT